VKVNSCVGECTERDKVNKNGLWGIDEKKLTQERDGLRRGMEWKQSLIKKGEGQKKTN
jgi:hypothetical protein